MKNKTIISFLIIVFAALLPLSAQKKPPQTPLKELTDPASRYYVPYPYPKTDFEIIEDFKYGIKTLFSHQKRYFKSLKKSDKNTELLLQLLSLLDETSAWEIKRIIRVEDMVVTSPCMYFFLLQIEDKNGEVVAVGSLEDCGLYAGASFYPDGRLRTYKTKEKVKKMVTDALGPVELNKIERIGIHSSLPCSKYSPLWRISTSEGTFFVDQNDEVYLVVEEVPWTINENDPDPERKRIVVLDGLRGKALFLEKVKTKREKFQKVGIG